MSLLGSLKKLFPVMLDYRVEDKFSSFEFKGVLNVEPQISQALLDEVFLEITKDDDFQLSITIEDHASTSISNRRDIEDFLDAVKESFRFYETGEEVTATLSIQKCSEVSIYSFEHTLLFWDSLRPLELLGVLGNGLRTNRKIQFRFNEPGIESFGSDCIHFGQIIPEDNVEPISIRENCHFGNFELYPFSPDYFFLKKRPQKRNAITDKLDILTTVFSLIALFDITSLGQNQIYYKLNGYKTHESSIEIDDLFIQPSNLYYSIFSWAYSSTANVTDKLGLARNVLSIYLPENVLELSEKALPSIQSAFKTYLKDNVNRYIEIRSNIFKELSWISQKAGEIVNDYLINYKRSIFSFISFFASVFLIKFLRKEDTLQVFGKEATLLSFGFLSISLIYLIFSLCSLYLEKKRLRRKYKNLKERFTDLLIEEDIDRILNGDSEFKYELGFIRARTILYTALWILTILILFIVVFYVSDYSSLSLNTFDNKG